MGKKRPPEDPPPAPARPFHDAFASLRDRLPPGYAPPPPTPIDAARPAPARAAVRLERTRWQKEVTVVARLALPPAALESWLADAKRALGCGGSIEDDALVLQGDHRERVARWLEGRGVRKVTVAD